MLFFPAQSLGQHIACFTTSVQGGVSTGDYQSFNIGAHVGDNSHRVETNRQLLSAIIKQQAVNRELPSEYIGKLKWLNQQHTNEVCDYQQVSNCASDGIYTSQTNAPLAIMTADCLPIVMSCQATGHLAAVHAGWRGLANNIIANAIKKFASADDINIWIGPSISQNNYEVSSALLNEFPDYPDAVKPSQNAHKYLFDLSAVAVAQLRSLGVSNIQTSPICTYTDKNCFSHRRATQLGSTHTGRMATVIIHFDE